MTEHEFKLMVDNWGLCVEEGPKYIAIGELIRYLDKLLYSEYDVIPKFKQRLNQWVNNVEDESDKKSLYELVPNLFFVGAKEFRSLYKTAYEENYIQWLLKTTENLRFKNTQEYTEFVEGEVAKTAFTQLTDSMNINEYYHANGVDNKGLSITWYNDARQGGEERVLSSIEILQRKGIERVVILDDHVGSGSQMQYVLDRIQPLLDNFEVLVIPLLCGNTGYERGLQLSRDRDFCFKPVLVMNSHVSISKDKENQSNAVLDAVKLIAERYKDEYFDQDNGEYPDIYGFSDSGSLLIMHTNCPNNTMVLIHSEYDNWKPLFPRQGGHR